MKRKFDIKVVIALIIFVVGILFALWVIYNEYSKTGCIYIIQKAEFALKYARKNPDGSILYPWNSGYKCVLNLRGIIMLIVASLIGLIIAFNTLRNRKTAS